MFDVAVIGESAGAVAAAREAARHGRRVALFVPALVPDAPENDNLFARTIRRHQTRIGLRPPPLPVDEPRIHIVRGPARFSRYRTVGVGGSEWPFRKAVIATGAQPGPITVAGANAAEPLRPSELDRLSGPPRSVAVLGGNGDACFWAQQLRRLGCEVHLIARSPQIPAESDGQAAQIIARQFEAEGIRIHCRCDDVRLDRVGNRRAVLIQRDTRYTKILVDEVVAADAAPRPNLAGLALETAAVRYAERGIYVDDRLRTTERRIFAAGGACGPEFASPEAETATGRLAAHNALSLLPSRLSRCVIPRYTPTDPPIFEFGLRAAKTVCDCCVEHRQTGQPGSMAGMGVTERRISIQAPPRPGLPAECEGCIAVRVNRAGRLVGATLVTAEAESLALPLMLLMRQGLPLRALGTLAPCREGHGRLLQALALGGMP